MDIERDSLCIVLLCRVGRLDGREPCDTIAIATPAPLFFRPDVIFLPLVLTGLPGRYVGNWGPRRPSYSGLEKPPVTEIGVARKAKCRTDLIASIVILSYVK